MPLLYISVWYWKIFHRHEPLSRGLTCGQLVSFVKVPRNIHFLLLEFSKHFLASQIKKDTTCKEINSLCLNTNGIIQYSDWLTGQITQPLRNGDLCRKTIHCQFKPIVQSNKIQPPPAWHRAPSPPECHCYHIWLHSAGGEGRGASVPGFADVIIFILDFNDNLSSKQLI